MIWLCSDFHFCHDKEFVWKARGFSSIDEMNNEIVRRFNLFVKPNDIVYILGDCMLKDNITGIKFLSDLKGIKYLAYGNHDTNERLSLYEDAHIFEDIQFGYRFKYNKCSFWLSHYPMKMGNYKDKHPTWNLSGHTHSTESIDGDDSIYNVAMDAHNCFPISIEQIMAEIKVYRDEHPVQPFNKIK